MLSYSRRAEKWQFLRLGAQWDRAVVPIYEAAAGGKKCPLFKTLLTSYCKNECKYCALRCGRRQQRDIWDPKKLAKVTMHLHKTGKIQGLFLSSSVFRDPDYTVEKELEVVRALRTMGYAGYIHLRLMPGTSRYLMQEAVRLVDRVGINLEAPTNGTFSDLCPDKGGFFNDIVKRLEWLAEEVRRLDGYRVKCGFSRAGVDTQMIVGAVQDNDKQFLEATSWLYQKLGLRRVYYSGFEPIPRTPFESNVSCPPFREYRLYQASFLIRDYGFGLEELAQIMSDDGFLSNTDPKRALASANPDMFPVDLNMADRRQLLRIPNVGPLTAKKILEARHTARLDRLGDLEKIVGSGLARRIAPYVELRDKKLTELFLK